MEVLLKYVLILSVYLKDLNFSTLEVIIFVGALTDS